MVHPAAAISVVGAVWRMSDGTKCVSHAARVGLFPTLGFRIIMVHMVQYLVDISSVWHMMSLGADNADVRLMYDSFPQSLSKTSGKSCKIIKI